jgi:hypothetical protein
MNNLTPNLLNNCFQKMLVNILSLSVTIEVAFHETCKNDSGICVQFPKLKMNVLRQ